VKTIPAALQAHYDSGSTRMAYGLLMKREDGEVFALTSCTKPLTLDTTPWEGFTASEQVFDTKQGLIVTDFVTTAGFNVDNLELTTLDDGTLFTREDILAGKWKNTYYLGFRYRWDVDTPTIEDDVEVIQAGWFGEISLQSATIKIELRGLTAKLQQPVGIVSTKTCRARLGSTTGINKCFVDLAPFTHTFEVTSVTDKRVFVSTDAIGSSFPDDWFAEGLVRFLTGANEGLEFKVRSFADTGTFTLIQPVVIDVEVGDTFEAIAGCRKTREVCRDKFNNVINFQGEPDRPLTDDLVSV
jgi:uncharacterized phage protein (TIGR02218 family)